MQYETRLPLIAARAMERLGIDGKDENARHIFDAARAAYRPELTIRQWIESTMRAAPRYCVTFPNRAALDAFHAGLLTVENTQAPQYTFDATQAAELRAAVKSAPQWQALPTIAKRRFQHIGLNQTIILAGMFDIDLAKYGTPK